MEFKVQDTTDEKNLSEKVALQQIEERKYETVLTSKGIPSDKIRKYGFAQGNRGAFRTIRKAEEERSVHMAKKNRNQTELLRSLFPRKKNIFYWRILPGLSLNPAII